MTTVTVTPQDIIDFYVDEVGPAGWYVQDDALDAKITERYLHVWEAARARQLKQWLDCATGTLALIIVLDQFPRNMFRVDGRAYATDGAARAVAKLAIKRGDDLTTPAPARSLYYMPLMHSESNADQCTSVRSFMGMDGETTHARAHREVIRKFGRFPTRNDMMGRQSSPAEQVYLNEGGYGAIVKSLSQNA